MEISTAITNSGGLSKLLLLSRHSPGPISAVRSDTYRSTSAPRALVRRTRRIRRKTFDASDGDGDDLLYGDGDDGPFGGGGGRGGGFGGDGWMNWGDDGGWSSESESDPAFDFVYAVVGLVALSNCTYFAVKKLGRILEERGKVEPIRLVSSVC